MNTKLLKCSKKSNYSDFLEHFNDVLIMEKTDIGIPNYVLISPEGIIVDKWAGYATGLLKQKVGENIK